MATKDYLETLQTTILLRYNCKAIHRETAFVQEKTGNAIVWEGNVEVFDLKGHKSAKECYAWTDSPKSGRLKVVTVLGSHLIDSAPKAVQAAIFTDVQRPGAKQDPLP